MAADHLKLRLTGGLDNPTFWAACLKSSMAYSGEGLLLRNIGIYPYTNDWTSTDDPTVALAPTMAYILYHGRALKARQRPDRDSVFSILMAEYLSPALPADLFLDQEKARLEFRKIVYGLVYREANLAQISPDATREKYQRIMLAKEDFFPEPFLENIIQTEEHPIADDWPLLADIDITRPGTLPSIESAMRVLYFIATEVSGKMKILGLDIIVNAVIAVHKRAIVSDVYLEKIKNTIMLDLKIQVDIAHKYIYTFYQQFGGQIDDANIHLLMRRIWENQIPKNALRFTLTMMQTFPGGLTSLITIGRAIKKYDDFNWGIIFNMFPEDTVNYFNGVTVVDGNVYYALRRNLGIVKTTCYANLAWIAQELLIRVGGELSLSGYRGWKCPVAQKSAADKLIAAYITGRNQGIEIVNDNDPGIVRHPYHARLLELVKSDKNRQLFGR
ncbi:unnamed protein product [Phaedon cochleariae]|uniref:Uncharacterized protein n=1 Tax=Phaedon cochleariae TaxID=80249 RepID=A0A9P0DI42_PHACE|nr:unnamed protein product [Phaedon cochleariae]